MPNRFAQLEQDSLKLSAPPNRFARLEEELRPIPQMEPGLLMPQWRVDLEAEDKKIRAILDMADKYELPISQVEDNYEVLKNLEGAPSHIVSEPVEEIEEPPFIFAFEIPPKGPVPGLWEFSPKATIAYQNAVAEYEEQLRPYKNFWEELQWQIGGGTVRLAAGGLATLGAVSEGAIWDKQQIEDTAQWLYELGERPELATAKGAGWKGFVTTATGQAAPYMGAACLATLTSGTSLGAFGVAFMAEGGNAYLDALKYGAEKNQALTNMFIVGTINGALEKLQIEGVWRFAKAGKGAKNAVLQVAKRKAWQRIIDEGKDLTYEYLRLVTTEATQEALQEVTSIAAEARLNPQVWENATERILSAAAGGGTVAGITGFGGRVGALGLRTKTDAIAQKYNERIKNAQERHDAEAVQSLRAMEQEELSQIEGISDQAIEEAKEIEEAKKPPEIAEKPPSKPIEPTKPIKPPAVAPKEAKEIKYEEKAITEPTPSPKVEPRPAKKIVPTGKLDPTDAKEALEIVSLHQRAGAGVGGVFETEWDKDYVDMEGRKGGYVVTSVEYTSKQVDTAYRTIQKPVESPMPNTDLFAMPGKEKAMKAIAEKMAKIPDVAKKRAKKKVGLTKPTALPKAKTKKEDHIKAVYSATSKEDTRYAINGVKVEGDTIVATDGRRLFWAKGKWGKDGVYLDAASLKKGSLGKLDKTKQKFPAWRDILPDVSDQKPILVPSGGVYEDLDTVFRRIRQAASMTTEESLGVTIIENKDGSLGFAAAAPEVGHVEINVNPGGRILGAVNPRFLMDAIKFHATRGDTAFEFYFKNWDRPMLTKSLDGKTSTLTMPIGIEPDKPSEAIKKAISEWPTKPEAKMEEEKVKPQYKARPGFVDLTPLAEAGEQIKTTTEKAAKVTTRFGGLESEVQKVLIEYEEQVREIPKVIAKDSIEKFGNLTTQQEQAIENHRENPKKYPDLPEELKPYLAELEKGIEEYGKRLEELGYPADWPNTYSQRLEKMLQKEQAKDEPNPEKIDNLEKAIEEAKDLQYLHHYYQKDSVGKRIWSRFRRRISKRPTGVLGRKIPTYEKAEALGLKRAPLAVSYAHMAHEIARAEMANDLITAINDNPNLSLPENQAPTEWVRLDERIFPASVQHQVWAEEGKPRHKRAFRKYPIPIAEALEEITYSRGNEAIERAYDKLNFGLKIIGFYNPLVMTKNDAVQIWRATGVKGFMPLVLPQIEFKNISIKPPRAVQIWMEKGPEYQKLRKGGLFNNIVSYTPAVTQITEEMLTHIRETSGEKAARVIGEVLNPVNLAKNMRKYNDMSTWNIDEIMRIAAYEAVKDTPLLKGMTDFEKIEWVNDALVNYGKMPKSTKRWIGKAMFVPTYRVGNFRYFWNEVSRIYQGQWWHIAPVVRTVAYKMFVKWGLPATIAAAIFWKTGEERDVYTEKGYRLVIHNPETNTDTIYALSDPLLEGAKLTQRTLRHTLQLNLAPLPSLLYRALKGPRYKQSDDPFGEFFKLGTPVYRDILNWKDPDKTVPQKILTQFAIAYVYSRRGREQDKEHVVSAIAKALSIWTDWKEQKADIFNMMTGRSFYSGPGGEFGRLLRRYSAEQDIDRAEIDKKIDSFIMKGNDENAIRMMLETERYQTTEGISGRLMQHKNPILYYWLVMPKREQAGFMKWLRDAKGFNQDEIDELISSLAKSKP